MILLRSARLIFWDFDGVIKESVDIKTRAFIQLFEAYGVAICERVRKHHEDNGGMSRFEKIPLYLKWLGQNSGDEHVEELCQRFGELVFRGVVEAPWVPGVENYLRSNHHQQNFVLVSATPQNEIELIIKELKLENSFSQVWGAPTSKIEAIQTTLRNSDVGPKGCLMIGDASADIDAALANQVPFLLRRHEHNSRVFGQYKGPSVDNFTHLS